MFFSTFVALLLADYDVVIHHILKPPERQKILIRKYLNYLLIYKHQIFLEGNIEKNQYFNNNPYFNYVYNIKYCNS